MSDALSEFLLDPRDDVPRRVGVDDERGDAFLARGLVGDGEDERDVGMLARRDELLDAVEHIRVTVAASDKFGAH